MVTVLFHPPREADVLDTHAVVVAQTGWDSSDVTPHLKRIETPVVTRRRPRDAHRRRTDDRHLPGYRPCRHVRLIDRFCFPGRRPSPRRLWPDPSPLRRAGRDESPRRAFDSVISVFGTCYTAFSACKPFKRPKQLKQWSGSLYDLLVHQCMSATRTVCPACGFKVTDDTSCPLCGSDLHD